MEATRRFEGVRFSVRAWVAAGVMAIALLAGGGLYLVDVTSGATPVERPTVHAVAGGDSVTTVSVSSRRGGTMWVGGSESASPNPMFHAPGSRAGGSRD